MKTILRFTFPAMIAVVITGHAQGWEREYGTGQDGGNCVQQTVDGGYIVTGYTCSLDQRLDMWLLKTDASGATLWTRGYGGESFDDGFCVQQTSDGGYVIVGLSKSSSIAVNGDNDIWIVKTDSVGDTLWTRVYGGEQRDIGYWIEQTSDGGYIVAGHTYSFTTAPPPAGTSIWLLKLDQDGDTLWTALHCGVAGIMVLGAGGHCVAELDDGFIVTGRIENLEKEGLWILRTDTLGDTLWTRKYGTSSCQASGYSIKLTLDGGYIIVGKDALYFDTNYVWLLKTDSMGDTLWTRTWGGGENSLDDKGYSVDVTADSGYVLTGIIDKDICLIKVDQEGTTEWIRTFGGDLVDIGYGVQQTADGGFITTGMVDNIALTYFAKLWLAKTDSLGNVAVTEPVTPTPHPDWEVLNSIGSRITLRYANRPEGFHASVFNAAGQKVDEVSSESASGTITWGKGQAVGVYFIEPFSAKPTQAQKVVLIR